jgi:hypothetical protein
VFEKKKNNFHSYYLTGPFSALRAIQGVKLVYFGYSARLKPESVEFLNQGKETWFIFHSP